MRRSLSNLTEQRDYVIYEKPPGGGLPYETDGDARRLA